jgi:uncharacterized repeat protein (TIGR03803 family)
MMLAAGVLSGCGGGGSSGPSLYKVGGTISGLTQGGLVLANNGGDNLSISAKAAVFTFATQIGSGVAYAVTVATQPTGQNCTVTSGAGTVSANVTSVSVTCVLKTFSLSGMVTGLASAAKLVLINASAADTVTVLGSGNGAFSFSTPISYGDSYDVGVAIQPPAQTCTVTGGSGSAVSSNVSDVRVACVAATESILYSFGTPPDGTSPVQLIQSKDGNFYGTTNSGGGASPKFAGTVFKITAAGVETVLYSFSGGADGGQPTGLIQGADGNFYGMTTYGGAAGDVNFAFPGKGTVFKLTPSGMETVLYAFQGGADGSNPVGLLLQGSDGNFYGMTGAGGTATYGTVFKVTPDGIETVLYSFQGTDGASPGAGLIQASDGNFYGTTASGGVGCPGNLYCGMVFRITPTGDETVLHTFQGGTDGNEPDTALVQGSDGNFYGTTEGGGTAGFGTIFKMTPAGVVTTLHSFQGGADGRSSGALLQASDGNFYSTNAGGTSSLGTIFQMTPAGAMTPLYSFQGNPNASGAPDGDGPLGPLVLGNDGVIYGVTTSGGTNNRGSVFKF